MKKMWRAVFYMIGLFFILPIILSIVFQNNFSLAGDDSEKIERYLPYILYEIIEKDMHMETLKAQAVLARTNILKRLETKELDYENLQIDYTFSLRKKTKEDVTDFERLERACQETKGEVVLYESELCDCPYFYCSNGLTRDAFTYFQDTRYPYLISVPSHRDEECDTFITYHYFSTEEFLAQMKELSSDTFENGIEILEYDDAGYITWLKIGDQIIGGEVFRNALDLSSSCFTVEQVEDGIRIACKGRGHGFGFSQYGANVMAQDKMGYCELIEYYFQDITIENVYTFS